MRFMYGSKEKDKREIRVDLIINMGKGRLRKGNSYTQEDFFAVGLAHNKVASVLRLKLNLSILSNRWN